MDNKEYIDSCISSALEIGREGLGKTLDFSEESISDVSEILDSYHERYLDPETDGGRMREKANIFAQIFGVYVGETLLRRCDCGYGWRETEYGLVLAKDENTMVNPVAKAEKQIVNGREGGDEIQSFYRIAVLIMEGRFPQKK